MQRWTQQEDSRSQGGTGRMAQLSMKPRNIQLGLEPPAGETVPPTCYPMWGQRPGCRMWDWNTFLQGRASAEPVFYQRLHMLIAVLLV